MLFLICLTLVSSQISLPLRRKVLPQNSKILSTSPSDSFEIINSHDVQYTADVYIGTPGQYFSLLLKTGSSYLWVEKSSCSKCADFDNQFNSKDSKTYKSLSQLVSNGYWDGSYYLGVLSEDIVSIGGSKGLSTSASFILVDMDNGFKSFGADGVLGLGFNQDSNNTLTFMDNLKKSGLISHKVFAMYINFRNFDGKGNGNPASNLMIGSYNISKYSSSPNVIITYNLYNPTSGFSGLWIVNPMEVTLGGALFNGSASVIFDSGSPYIYTPEGDYYDIAINIMASMGVGCKIYNKIIRCTVKDRKILPSLSFSYNKISVNVDQNRLFRCGDGYCDLMVIESDNNYWVVGDVLLRQYYTIYDMDNMTISFTPAINNDSYATYESSMAGVLISIGAFLALF
ncbi:hypothetical protein SteCoe_22704 [Stentor coeruleus]|uniref:Peptidase A1 domain-containing protein n=1 Tax=Stentor coeruleus TaxID=5963 RepID=A0A1R2BLR0_9CILI|nr:hypothetical protein SteCoe_22704 [Stentor coeruleus]